jgi:hypothetical protein
MTSEKSEEKLKKNFTSVADILDNVFLLDVVPQ